MIICILFNRNLVESEKNKEVKKNSMDADNVDSVDIKP